MSKFHQFREDGNEGEDEKEDGENGRNNIINLIDRLEESGIPSPINKNSNNIIDNFDNSSIYTKRTQKSYNKSQKTNVNVKIPEEDLTSSNYNDDNISKSIKEQKPITNYNLINLEINLNIDKEKHFQYKIAQNLPKTETTDGNISSFNDTSNNMLANPFDMSKYYLNRPKNYNNYSIKDIDLNVDENKKEDNNGNNDNNNNNNKNESKKKKSHKKLENSNKILTNIMILKNNSCTEKNRCKKYTVKKNQNPHFICKINCQCPRISYLVLFRNVCIISIIVSSFVFYWLILFCD